MSKENKKTPVSKATNVAEVDENNESDTDNIITSEFVIVSSDEQSEVKDNAPVSKKSDKKTSSKDVKKKKTGPDAKMLDLLKERQRDRQNAELEAEKEAKRLALLREENERKEAERLRLEQHYRDKRNEKDKLRIQRQREEGSYLTKNARQKYLRAQVQLGAAGVDVPTRHAIQLKGANTDESDRKRILYDDRRKANRTATDVPAEQIATSTESEGQVLIEDDTCEHDWDEVDIDRPVESTDDEQLEVIDNKSEPMDNVDEDSDPSLSPLESVHGRLEKHHKLRAPVICVLGHVDAGKTSILDNLRQTHVQAKEAGGITQQIGATNVPIKTIHERTKMCRERIAQTGDLMIPGLLIIDTPGHETFKNLRSRGSSLCDIAILVVDIMHGLAPQTIESIQLLKEKKTPFIIALNKVDLMYGWKSDNEKDIESVLQQQTAFTQNHFEKRCNQIIVEFAQQELNVALYYKNSDPTEFYSMVPTSARTGDGMGSLIAMIIEQCQTNLVERITYSDELQATVMEVKKLDDLGTTIDVALVNGCLSVGDKIVTAGLEGPIVTRIREIRIPDSNEELRVTNQYQKHRSIQGACGVKLIANDLEKSMAGFPLFVVRQKDEIEYYQNEIEQMLRTAINSIELKDKGVYVQASTLGSLEAFLQLLRTHHIPYAGVNIGAVHRKDVIRASIQLEKDPEYAIILAFDVKIERDAQEYANTTGIKILQSDEIYRLLDMYKLHREELKALDKEKYRHLAVFPCKLQIMWEYVFNKRSPIICGVRVEEGFVRLGTPICVPSKEGIDLGRIVSIERNHKSVETAVKGTEVCIKIEPIDGETPKMYGRHFDHNDLLVSRISRQSIDTLKSYFRDEMQRSDWELIVQLKRVFNVI